MKDSLKRPIMYKDRLLVAKCDDYSLVFGIVVKRIEPEETESRCRSIRLLYRNKLSKEEESRSPGSGS